MSIQELIATASNAVLTSAKTASHIIASPIAPSYKKMVLTEKAMKIFCQTIQRVCLAIEMDSTSFAGESVMSTTSAVSIAASLSSPPIATPIEDDLKDMSTAFQLLTYLPSYKLK